MRFRTSISASGSARTPTSTHSVCFRREAPPTLLRHPRRRPPQPLRLLRRPRLHRPLSSRRRLPLPSRLHLRPSRRLLPLHSRSRYPRRRSSAPRLVRCRCRERRLLRPSLPERSPRRWHGALDPPKGQSTRSCRPEVRQHPRERTCAGRARQLRRAALTAWSPRGRLSALWSADRLPRISACPISCGTTRPCSSTSRLRRGSLTPRRSGSEHCSP